MLDKKKLTPIIGALGALALMIGAPALAQETTTTAAPPAVEETVAPVAPPTMEDTLKKSGERLTIRRMFLDATLPVKVIMAGLLLAAILSWVLAILKFFEFASVNRSSNRFLEAFRTAKTIPEMGKIAMSEEFEGNPMADMAAAAAQEIELSRQAGLSVNGEHRDATLSRAVSAVGAVQAQLSKRLSGGMQYQASLGATGPFVGLFGTVYGIMNSFIGIAESNTTNLAVVAPGIAEALLATGIGLMAAIPAVWLYNYFQSRIIAYGTRTEGFVAELMNYISRQLDKGA